MTSQVSKSYHTGVHPVITYCSTLTAKLSTLQQELQEHTLKNVEMSRMLGAPEVLTVGENFIHLTGGKRCLDIGTYTGASALAWALATPDDGKVYTFDVCHNNYKTHGLPIISKCEKTAAKIVPVEGSALESLDKLIADGGAGTFDFAFIDADKLNYSNYYDRCVTLLRSGGVIMVDNALWSGKVATCDDDCKSTDCKAIDECNRKISADERTNSALFNCGDGLHVAFKK